MPETARENATNSAPRGLRLGKLRFSAVEMLIALVLLFVATPFIEGLPDGDILRFILRTRRVNGEVLCASISVYLMFGLLWAMGYRLVAHLAPAAFTFNSTQVVSQPMEGFTAFYFSFVTLTTVGYGDITPVSPIARMLAVMESMTGTLYVAVLIARLVALYSTPDSSAPASKSDASQS